KGKIDGFVKSPSAALPCILRRCGVLPSTPHSSGIVRLASGVFYFAIQILTFYEFIKIYSHENVGIKRPSSVRCREEGPAFSVRRRFTLIGPQPLSS
ncbi:MAG: hypothetical protein NTY64_06875, partial [Deltaproteobacteria bacterium]|nr:hypothetical protein [Deltaproteobacteria bacterium]